MYTIGKRHIHTCMGINGIIATRAFWNDERRHGKLLIIDMRHAALAKKSKQNNHYSMLLKMNHDIVCWLQIDM